MSYTVTFVDLHTGTARYPRHPDAEFKRCVVDALNGNTSVPEGIQIGTERIPEAGSVQAAWKVKTSGARFAVASRSRQDRVTQRGIDHDRPEWTSWIAY